MTVALDSIQKTGYKTRLGSCVCGDSLHLLEQVEDSSIDLVITSPPFALQRQKEYGNESQINYVDWLLTFAEKVFEKLKDTGSFVIDIGGAYEKGIPSYSIYQFKALIAFCDQIGFKLAQPFYWHNPSALPAPIEWVNKRKLRAKNSVNTIWWLTKTPFCKANVSNVLTPYSSRMEKLIQNPEGFVKEEGTVRPSGHVMGKKSWMKNNGGAIPPNLLQISNSESNSNYLSICKKLGVKSHPARFPVKIPEFFIKFLTDEDDLVVDIFAGSNTTGYACEKLNRKWLAFELSKEYVATSSFRFCPNDVAGKKAREQILNGAFFDLSAYSSFTQGYQGQLDL